MVESLQDLDLILEPLLVLDLLPRNGLASSDLFRRLVLHTLDYSVGASAQHVLLVHLVAG